MFNRAFSQSYPDTDDERHFRRTGYDHIFHQLLRRDLRPGDLLDRKQIAEDPGVSLIPVSEAAQRLAPEGFLVTCDLERTRCSRLNPLRTSAV
jgi:DNA-binding GntR family transcriptional regulator